MDYKSKYLKYKNKYETLKKQTGGQPKIVDDLSDENDNKNIYIDQKKPYWDLFYRSLNQNTTDYKIRYDDVQLQPQAGRIIERLIEDVIDLKVTVKKLEKKIDDHYHEVPTTGVRYFNKGQKGPIPDYQPTIEKVKVDGPKIVQGGPKIVQGGPKIVQGGPKIVPVENEQGQNIVEKIPETGEYNTGIVPVEKEQGEDKCQLNGGDVISVEDENKASIGGSVFRNFGIVDYVEDGKIYAYFGDSHKPRTYDCNLFYNYDQRYRIHPEKKKNDIAVTAFGPIFWDDSLGRRPFELREFIKKHDLKLPPNRKAGFIA